MSETTPQPGDRRPREGRCERCDRPLTDEVYGPDPLAPTHLQWWWDGSTETHCCGDVGDDEYCDAPAVDWRARALAAESRLSVPATSADTTRLHRIRARLLELVPADGTMSLWDDVQRLDRALADAEARGRAHGLLAAAMWVLGELDRYERAHGDLPVVKWPDLDRGYRLALQNVLAALAIIDPMRRAGDGETRFCATEADDAD